MSDTIKISICPKCNGPIPPEAPQGLCPKCVLGGAASPTEAGGSATATGEIPTIPRIAAAFPQLEIIELIGRGGMGFVFKARQPHLDRFVALKLLPDKLAKDPHFAERFNREGRVLAKLNHPNIVSVFDFGQTSDFYFLLMEYVDGVNLRQAMRAGRFSPAEALGIVPKVCEALQYAHEQGVLHRDIKPENILLDAKGRVKIADFGIAKLVGEDAPAFMLTGTGHALGTPHYMAPEQLEKPGEVDHRADIYSLGVVFYEMLTGELPIGRFAAPSTKTPVDQRVDEIVFRALEKERELRQKNVTEFRTQVENVTSSPRAASAEMPPARAASAVGPKWSQKAVWAAGLTALSLPLPLLMMVLAYFGSRGMIALEIAIALAAISLPGLAGAILGWMALSDIRAHQGQLRGLPLAVFAALTWPLLLLVGGTLVIPSMIAYRAAGPGGSLHLAAMLMLLVPVGAVTFAIWAVYAAARWGGNKPASERRRGVLKWVFLALLFFGVGIVLTTRLRGIRNEAKVSAQVVSAETNATPWIRFTFTAVELRELAGVRWLAIDYLDDVHGECQKSFPWETTIPGFKAETRSTEFITDAKDSSPAVRHQRIEYRMPDSSPRDQLERLRDELEKTLQRKSFRLELGANEVPLTLFELPGVEGGSLKARIKVMPPLKVPPQNDLVDRPTTPNANRTGASAELWAPDVAPGEKPRPYEILQEAARLAREGRYEEALQRHLWYHHHALEFQPSQAGVRLSFALQQWMELARRYPRAKDALVEVRDENVREFSDSGGSFRAFTEISFINKALKEDYATIGLFKSIQARSPRLARQCYQLVEDSLVETGEYAVCESFIPDIQKRFDEIRAKREKYLEEARNPKAAPAALRQVAQQNFIKETRALVEILVGVGRKSEAEGIRDQAVAIVNDPQLQSAVADAEARIGKRVRPPEYLQLEAQIEELRAMEKQLSARYTSNHPVVLRAHEQLRNAEKQLKALQTKTQ